METVRERLSMTNENEDQNSIVEDARLYPEVAGQPLILLTNPPSLITIEVCMEEPYATACPSFVCYLVAHKTFILTACHDAT